MCLLYGERIKQHARKLINSGTIRGLVIFRQEDGVIEDIVNNEQQATLWMLENEPKDDSKYSITTIDLREIIDKEGIYYVK